MKKRNLLLVLALSIGLVLLATLTVEAKAKNEPLYQYDLLKKNGNKYDLDNYGYNQRNQLKYYPQSNKNIVIPTEYKQDKRQFKSAWIATIANLHMPRPKNEQHFKQLYTKRLNDFVDWNMNAMIFQVRPLLDAYYPSKINPTSQYLSGKQGKDVNYDPLEWMIEETHKAGLEYHAWLNPYRVTNTDPGRLLSIKGKELEKVNKLSTAEYLDLLVEKGILAKDNFAVKNPELVIRYEGKLILNPGYPETIQHVLDTIEEIITKYDVDAIHFDDYFYPYGTTRDKKAFNLEDRDAFEKYGLAINAYADSEAGVQEWRRDNVTNLIKDIQKLLKGHNQKNKTAVQLGISPFGIWEHHAKDSRGSHTATYALKTYSESIFADTRKWVDEELVDYMMPQIYWEFNHTAAPYAEIAQWWDGVANNKKVDLYVGHGIYKYLDNAGNNTSWFNPDLINNQLYFNQQFDNIKGSALYSYQHMTKKDSNNKKGYAYLKYETLNRAIDRLQNDTFSVQPLTTEKSWLSHNNVRAINSVEFKDNKLTIRDTINDDARFYVVYQGKKGQSKQDITSRPENIIEKIFATTGQNQYEVNLGDKSDQFVYYVSVLDRASVETDAVQAKEYQEYIAVNDQVLRWRADDRAASNGFIAEGETVELLEGKSLEWFKVRYQGQEGYIRRGEVTSIVNYNDKSPVKIHQTAMNTKDELDQLVVTIDTNLRSKDEDRYRPIQRLARETQVTYKGTTMKNWFKVEVQGQEGYIYRGDVTSKENWDDKSEDKKIHSTEMIAKEKIDRLEVLLDVNLRTKDHNQYQPLTFLPKGSKLKYLGTTANGWFKVQDETGQKGYVYRGTVTKIEN